MRLIGEYKLSLEEKTEPNEINAVLESAKETAVSSKKSYKEILKRPNITIDMIDKMINHDINIDKTNKVFIKEVLIEVEAGVKYEGYIERQQKEINKLKKSEHIKIPKTFDYMNIKSISNEGKDKLTKIRPENLGQAMRISGITPADISVLSIMLIK